MSDQLAVSEGGRGLQVGRAADVYARPTCRCVAELLGATTLPVYLYSMLRVGVSPEANAAATMLMLMSALAVVASAALIDRRGRPVPSP